MSVGSGADVVRGSASELDGSTIFYLGEDDRLEITGLTAASVVERSGVSTTVDVDGDGTVDYTFSLYGDGIQHFSYAFDGTSTGVLTADASITTTGDDTNVEGDEGNDTLDGLAGNDVMYGLGGDDS